MTSPMMPYERNPISKGHIAYVDDDDFDRINKYRWCYHGNGYAARGYHDNGMLIIVKLHQEIMGKPKKRL